MLLTLVIGLAACGGESLPLANADKLGLQARTIDDLLELGIEDSSDQFEAKAVELARQNTRSEPGRPVHWVNLQTCLSRLSDKQGQNSDEEQRKCLAKARALEPDQAAFWSRSAEIENSLDHWAAAAEFSERAIRLEPNMPVHYLPLAVALRGEKKHAEAAQAIHRARELHWTQIHPTRLYILSEIFKDKDAFDVHALRLLAQIYGDAADQIYDPSEWDEQNHSREQHDALIEQKLPRSLSATCLVLSELTRTGDQDQANTYLRLFGTDESEDAKSADLRRLRTEVRGRLARIEAESLAEIPADSAGE